MDKRAIGVFDSGLGGLTAVKELRSILPGENIIYFGDTGRVPYGTRPSETILKYVRQDIRFLLSHDIKAVLAACNTASSVALPFLEGDYEIPVVGVIEGAAKAAVAATKNKKIGVVGTPRTILSRAYERALLALDPGLFIQSQPCAFLVPIVENGRFRRGDPVAEIVVSEYFSPLKDAGVDTLILGCTHYPLLTDVIGDFLGGGVTLINSGREAALLLRDLLSSRRLLSPEAENGKTKFYVSDDVYDFSRIAGDFLGCDLAGDVADVDIENY